MEQSENFERDVNEGVRPDDEAVVDTISGEQPDVEKVAPTRRRMALGRVVSRLQAARKALREPNRNTRMLPETPVARATEEEIEDAIQIEALSENVTRWVRRLLIPLAILAWAGVVILLLWAAGHVTRTILLLVIATLLAYALSPLVTLLERVLPRFLSILIVYLVVMGGIGTLLYFIVRTTVDQIISFSSYLELVLTPGKNGHPSALEQTLLSLGISQEQVASARSQILSQAGGLAGNIVPVLTGVAGTALDIILVAVMSVYLLIDGKRIVGGLRSNMPRRQRGRIRFLLDTLQRVVGGYIRGQLFLCGLIGLLVGAGMQIIGVPYALLLGVLAFVLEFIPVLGTLISGAICVLLALTKGWLLAIIVLVYFIIVHVIEGDVVGPRIVGKAIGLHPVVSLAALIAGGELFGIWGALFASPVAGVIQAFLIAIWSEWRETHPQEFQAAKDKVAEHVEKNVANKPVGPEADSEPEPEPEAKLLS